MAIKAGQFEIALLLLERGADANFMESSALNPWQVPVLHDAIRAAVFSSRFGRNRALPGQAPHIEVLNTPEHADHAFAVLAAIVARGADPARLDSAGNPALMRAVLDARQVIEEPISPDLTADLQRIFDLLIEAGSNPDWKHPSLGQSIADRFANTSAGRFLPTR